MVSQMCQNERLKNEEQSTSNGGTDRLPASNKHLAQ